MARSADTLMTLPEITQSLAKQKATQTKVRTLLTEGAQLQTIAKKAGERLGEIKSELAQIQLQHDLLGLRSGRFCCITVEREGRSSLSKEMLVDEGVPPSVIAACMKKGNSFLETRLEVVEGA